MHRAPTYLDYNATAVIRPQVIDLVKDVMAETGNASSIHTHGQKARGRVEKAREQVASLINVKPEQVIFTSGATESNNTVLCPYAQKRALISAIEHLAVLQPLPQAEKIPVTKNGTVDLDAFEKMLGTGELPAIISVMLVNSETGVIQPVKEIAAMARARNVLVHSDAVQALGRIPLDFHELGLDYMSLSAHKMGGPQGVGALVIRDGVPFEKFMKGGTQERLMRAGTVNVAGIAGFGLAAEIAEHDLKEYARITSLRDSMEDRMKAIEPSIIICGSQAPRVGNTSSLSLPGVSAQTQMMSLDLAGIAVSSGSACSSGSFKPSHVLQAMGFTEEESKTALRISLGWATTPDEIDHFVEAWSTMVQKIKK